MVHTVRVKAKESLQAGWDNFTKKLVFAVDKIKGLDSESDFDLFGGWMGPPLYYGVGNFGSGILYYCQRSEIDETLGWTLNEGHDQHVSTS